MFFSQTRHSKCFYKNFANMWLACQDPPKNCLTCVISPAVWLLKEGSQYFLVLWLTWAIWSYLLLLVLSAEIGLKQNSNRRPQIKVAVLHCIFSFFPLLPLEKLPSSVGYITPPPHKLTMNFRVVVVVFFYMWNTQRESAKNKKRSANEFGCHRLKVHSEVCLSLASPFCVNNDRSSEGYTWLSIYYQSGQK